jgi:hypothetical protein
MAAGCDTGNGGGDGSNNVVSGAFISGSFNMSAAGGGEVTFVLNQDALPTPAASVSVFRSVREDAGNTLSGVLEDGDLAIRLRGIYDPMTGNWSVSARSDSAIYTFDGNFDTESRESQGAIATVVEGTDERWEPNAFWVREEPVNLPETADASPSRESQLPSIALGNWSHTTTQAESGTAGNYLPQSSLLVSDWKMNLTGTKMVSWRSTPLNQDITILEVKKNEDDSYELIYCYPEYVITAANLKRALAEYMGIEENEVTLLAANYELANNDTDPAVYVVEGSPPWMGATDIEHMSREKQEAVIYFGITGFWKRWAAHNNIETMNRYEKCKISFPDDNTLNMTQMVKEEDDDDDGGDGGGEGGGEATVTVPDYTYYFDSLANLKSATLVEEQETYYDYSSDDSGELSSRTKVITYNRQ